MERVRRENIDMDPFLLNAGLIYNEKGKNALEKIYKQYLAIGKFYDVPMIVLTPTWRANKERIEQSPFSCNNVNRDCFSFLNKIRASYGNYAKNIFIGGLIGCKGDAYKPAEGLSIEEAYEFHRYQIEALSESGVDFLIAETIPTLSEAIGISKLMAETGKYYVISFVIRPNGELLDGTSLNDAISKIDLTVKPEPLFYMVNCVHPSVLRCALISKNVDAEIIGKRLLGIQANASSLSPEELDQSDKIHSDDKNKFVALMKNLHVEYGLKIFGGCCGTDASHIQGVIEAFLKKEPEFFR
ncbi:MAG TPA: homocysteine S-methyltransferase family protein [Candidatus Wallbacteria bacterium]|nr:homocysteine S-methyltransferase family protein [Candidatus Wallbacteria bacterium]